MKKALLPAIFVMIVLIFGMMLAYLFYVFIPSKETKTSAPEVRTEIVTKEVKIPVETQVKPSKKDSLKSIIKATQDKVVQIETSSGLGSGFLYNNKGDIVTNAHVVGYDVNVIIKTSDQHTYEGKVIGRSDHTDLALIRVAELANTTPLKMKEEKGELGDDVVALGSPLGLQNTVTVGIISGMDRTFTLDPFVYENMYQITAPISPGNSGGPIVSGVDGSVLGINSVKYTTEDIGFSIPIYTVLPRLNEWSKNPMTLSSYEDDYEFEVPEYSGEITEEYEEEYKEGYDEEYHDSEDYDGYVDEEYDTGAGENSEEEYPFEEPVEELPRLTSDEATDLVFTYYDYINDGYHEEAYNLISGNWKASYPTLEEFTSDETNIRAATITSDTFYENGDGTIQVDVIVESYDINHELNYYELSFFVGLENDIPMLLGKTTY
jgi:serine protease Do